MHTVSFRNSATSHARCPKTSWKEGMIFFLIFDVFPFVLPLEFPFAFTPWYFTGLSSATDIPLPFFVNTCNKTGLSRSFIISKVLITSSKSCPSIGPKYLKPISSNNIPGTIIFLILLSNLLKNDCIVPFAKGSFFVIPQASCLSLL